MIYKSVSIKEVVARIVRNTRIQDSSYIQDMNEWIPEAMGYMNTYHTLSLRYGDVVVNFHKGRLPSCLSHIEAVEYKGYRLPFSSTIKAASTGHNINSESTEVQVFSSVLTAATDESDNAQFLPTAEGTTETLTWASFTTYEDLATAKSHPSEWYQTELDHIVTSFADGVVRIHYKGIPTDDDGMPLIPDNQNYKEALYWYVRSKMYGAGYEEKQYKEGDMMQRFEMYAARAISQITYPSPDVKEQQIKTHVRFIPPANYYENFFRVDNHEQPLGY